MKKFFTLITGLALMASAANAQELANFSRNGASTKSPEFSGDSVYFRLSAPYATQVTLSGSWSANNQSIPMVKGANGVWETKVKTPDPEIYTYNFVVDGVSVNDPQNYMVQRDGTRYLNMLMVPGERTENYFEANHRGTVQYRWYDSKCLGINRRLTVYTPYGYEQNPNKKYPVLYLLHGAGGDEEAWTSMGRAAQILDNLIEKGLAVPMIVVMPNGNPNQQAASTMGLATASYDRNSGVQRDYVTSLCEEIVPFIEKEFRAIAKPESRAIAGLSMGGGHTLSSASRYPALFDYICPLSAAGQMDATQAAALKKTGVKLFWVGCGNADFLWQGNQDLKKVLEDAEMPNFTFFESEGGHVWANWRLYLNTFARLLFK